MVAARQSHNNQGKKEWSGTTDFWFPLQILSFHQGNQFGSVQFSRSVVSDSLRPHESQRARPPCPSPAPYMRVHLPEGCLRLHQWEDAKVRFWHKEMGFSWLAQFHNDYTLVLVENTSKFYITSEIKELPLLSKISRIWLLNNS